MRTLAQIASALREQAKSGKITQAVLRQNAGVSRQTLTNVFSGTSDYKVTTLLAIADRLGMELILLPKVAAVGLADGMQTNREPLVKSIVEEALERLHSGEPGAGSGLRK